MSKHAVSYRIVRFGKRYRARILVDEEYEVDHAWFDDKPAAEQWAKEVTKELAESVRK
jgi:phage terminase large subunit GpA-like protein